MPEKSERNTDDISRDGWKTTKEPKIDKLLKFATFEEDNFTEEEMEEIFKKLIEKKGKQLGNISYRLIFPLIG